MNESILNIFYQFYLLSNFSTNRQLNFKEITRIVYTWDRKKLSKYSWHSADSLIVCMLDRLNSFGQSFYCGLVRLGSSGSDYLGWFHCSGEAKPQVNICSSSEAKTDPVHPHT